MACNWWAIELKKKKKTDFSLSQSKFILLRDAETACNSYFIILSSCLYILTVLIKFQVLKYLSRF